MCQYWYNVKKQQWKHSTAYGEWFFVCITNSGGQFGIAVEDTYGFKANKKSGS
jgi:hypothetical protein